MNYIIRLKILFLVLLSSSFVQAQTAEECLGIADNYLSIGEYKSAVHMYRRVLFFDESLAEASYMQMGECYMAMKQYDAARYFFQLASQRADSDSVKNDVFFRSIASYIVEGKYLFAKSELLAYSSQDSIFKSKANFYNAIVAYHMGDLDLAEMYFRSIFPQEDHRSLEQLIAKAKKLARKKPYLALGMSAVVPGLGQAYAGEWQDAANSFVLNMLTTTLYFYVIASYSYLDAVMAVLPWWHRYYVGGFTNARDMVRDQRSEKLGEVLNEILFLYSPQLIDE